MADEELVAELAREVAAALRAACPTEEQCLADEDECFQRHPIHHGASRDGVIVEIWAEPDATAKLATEAVLAWLDGQGRLTPDGAEVVEEWGMRYRLNGKPTSPEDTGHVFSSREEAELHLRVWRREYPMLAYTDVEYLRRDEITTPWVAVPEGPA